MEIQANKEVEILQTNDKLNQMKISKAWVENEINTLHLSKRYLEYKAIFE